MNRLTTLLVALSKAPDTQLDSTVTKEIKNLVSKPIDDIVIGLKKALDDSAHCGLASTFTMKTMDTIYNMALSIQTQNREQASVLFIGGPVHMQKLDVKLSEEKQGIISILPIHQKIDNVLYTLKWKWLWDSNHEDIKHFTYLPIYEAEVEYIEPHQLPKDNFKRLEEWEQIFKT